MAITATAGSKTYIGDFGTVILLDCGSDISTATLAGVWVRKPNGKYTLWRGVVYETQYVKYIIKEGDLDQTGVYNIQAKIEMPSWSGLGETSSFTVYNMFQ